MYLNVENSAIRSFSGEQALIDHRDRAALWAKYAGSPLQRLVDIVPEWRSSKVGNDFEYPYPVNVSLATSPITAVANDVVVARGDSTVTLLDLLDSLDIGGGLGRLRTDLGNTAAYMQQYNGLFKKPLVLGVTHKRMAAFAVRSFGFNAMKVYNVESTYASEVEAAHRVYCAFNGIKRPFELAAVFMRPANFIDTFLPFATQAPESK